MSLQWFFSYVLRARLPNLQFLKTAFMLKHDVQPSELHMHPISFFHGFDIYIYIYIYTIDH